MNQKYGALIAEMILKNAPSEQLTFFLALYNFSCLRTHTQNYGVRNNEIRSPILSYRMQKY